MENTKPTQVYPLTLISEPLLSYRGSIFSKLRDRLSFPEGVLVLRLVLEGALDVRPLHSLCD